MPPQAVAEIAELLELAPAQVQDTLSFYGFFGRTSRTGAAGCGCAARSVARPAAAKNCWIIWPSGWAFVPARPRPTARSRLQFAECLGACESAPAMLVNETLYKDLTKEKIDDFVASIGNETACETASGRPRCP